MLLIVNVIILTLVYQTCGNEDYILNSAKCKIPDIEPFNEEVEALIQPDTYASCNETELLTYVKKIDDETAVLFLRDDLIRHYTKGNISCCYSYVTRKGSAEEPDVGIKISECLKFREPVTLTQDIVKVICEEENDVLFPRIVYQNVHNPVVIKDSVKPKLKNSADNSKKFSVLFIVIDSISRLNFIRTMNQSYNYLIENNFTPMKGYTKVADNTFPNFGALLTGLNLSGLQKKCAPQKIGGMDVCPMIWNDYREHGYITAYAEDNTHISTFNYEKKGFTNPPTDYYFKSYLEASETLPIRYSHDMPYCTGPETAGERVLNLAKDFSTTFKKQSTFGIFWMNTFSHDDVNAPYQMDKKLKQFFVDIKNEGVLDESIVILLSDHGVRFGDILNTQSGWLEERMPLNIISVPKKFQKQFPEEYNNFKENANKLTSTHDLYTTLQHILELSRTNYTGQQSSACSRCVSLFKKIPSSRPCKYAGIPPEWCTCMGHFQNIDVNHDYVKNATNVVLAKLNASSEFYSKRNLTCNFFTLDQVRFSSISENLVPHNDTQYLFVVIQTVPSAVVYTTVKFKEYVSSSSMFYMRKLGAWDPCH